MEQEHQLSEESKMQGSKKMKTLEGDLGWEASVRGGGLGVSGRGSSLRERGHGQVISAARA